jgi:hypothetical protein
VHGGIDLRHLSWNFSKSSDLRLPVTQLLRDQEQRYRKKGLHVDDVPMPYIPGWCPPARAGEQALVALKETRLGTKANAAEVQQQIAIVRHKAEMIASYDRMLNSITHERVEAMKELGQAKEAAEARAEEMIETFADTLTALNLLEDQYLVQFKGYKAPDAESRRRLLEIIENVSRTKELLGDATRLRDICAAHGAQPEDLVRVAERATELAIERRKLLQLLAGTSPAVANYFAHDPASTRRPASDWATWRPGR